MLIDIWRESTTGRILVNILGAISILVALYLLLIAYRKLVQRYGRGKRKKVTVKYADVYDLKPRFAKGQIQFGFELHEDANVSFNILNIDDEVVVNLHEGILKPGIHPFVFDTTKYPNGYYYYQYKSDIQNVIKKFAITN